MFGCLFIKMLYILFLCRALLAVGVITLSIDSQLGTSIEDCFVRVSIGEQLLSSAIYRNVSELTTKECEQICKQDKQCQTYDYGVGAKGNATCDLSNTDEKELKEKNLLLRHPDYDVYVRRIQCEQSPPTPLQTQFDDPVDGPTHRPVFRPDIDEPKRPLADFQPDLRPYETGRPDTRPYTPYRPPYSNHLEERPDDYTNQATNYDKPPSYGVHKPQDISYRPVKPQRPNEDFDRPPSYGVHKPQQIPYKPEQPNDYINQRPDFDRPPSYGLHKPQDIPYRPDKPYKPDAYDVLQFQNQHGRPPRPQDPAAWRPDPHYPPQAADDIPDIYGPKPTRPGIPPYRPEDVPQYLYITRPTKKPRPPEDTGYNKPSKPVQDYPTKPDPYRPNDPGPIGPPNRPYTPLRPTFDYPYKPYERPTYDYQGQYASNYGQNQNQDNSVYLEIYDPPRPYKPTNDRPSYVPSGIQGYGSYGSGLYGYGGSSSQNSYSQSQNSQSHYYGSGTITQLDNYNRPQQDSVSYKPQKPSDTNSNYGSQSTHQQLDQSYGSQSSYGTETSNKPSAIYHKPSNSNQGSYGSNQGSYESNQGSYGSNQGSYGSNQGSYGSNQGSYSSNQASYGSQSDSTQSYGSSTQSSYGVSILPTYGSGQGGYGQQDTQQQSSYGSYGTHRPLSDNKPSYGDNKPSYGDNKPSYGDDKPSYGNKPSYDDKPSYGNKPYDDKPSYGNNPSYDDIPSYGSSRPPNKPTYDYNRPNDDRPSYTDDRPTYGSNRPPNKPLYDDNRPDGDLGISYGNDQPSYGSNQPTYGSNQPTYGSNQPTYGNRPSYGSTQTDYGSQTSGYGSQVEDNKNSGYGNQKPDKPNKTDGYNQGPDVKPVYEYEVEKPGNVPSYIVKPGGEVITSRPVTIGDYGRPSYGRDPGHEISYKAICNMSASSARCLLNGI